MPVAGCGSGAPEHFEVESRLVGLLPNPRFRLWRCGHDVSFLDDHAGEILGFYADALETC